MRYGRLVVAVILFATGACGGDDDSSDDAADADAAADADENGEEAGDDDVFTGQSADFDLESLPDNFPSELVPPDWDTGQFTDLTGIPTATFESSASFEDVVAYYDGVHGESLIVGNDPGEELAQWTKQPPWIVSVFNGDPMLIGISELVDE